MIVIGVDDLIDVCRAAAPNWHENNILNHEMVYHHICRNTVVLAEKYEFYRCNVQILNLPFDCHVGILVRNIRRTAAMARLWCNISGTIHDHCCVNDDHGSSSRWQSCGKT